MSRYEARVEAVSFDPEDGVLNQGDSPECWDGSQTHYGVYVYDPNGQARHITDVTDLAEAQSIAHVLNRSYTLPTWWADDEKSEPRTTASE